MKRAMTLAITLAAEIGAIASTITPNGSAAVKICIEDSSRSPWLMRSESIAAEIFAGIGIRTEWLHPRQCPAHSPGLIVIQISTGAPTERFPGALAYARVAENTVEVFFNRIADTVPSVHIPTVLGYVLAHETAHILEGVGRHSDEGLMKAIWSSRDFERMFWGSLQFTPEDVQLIRAGAAAFRRPALNAAR